MTEAERNSRDSGPCTKRAIPGEVIGRPCDACGHINLLHPGAANPAVRECLVCVIERQAYGGAR